MADLQANPTLPVWLAEDDLGCAICHGLLDWPTTLPCGHTFCRDCLQGLWGARGPVGGCCCPTCRARFTRLSTMQKNTLLQDLADKYSRAVSDLDGGQRPEPAPQARTQPVTAQKSTTEVTQEVAELVGQLVDIVRSLQSERHPQESGPDNELNKLDMAFSDGVSLSSTSPKLIISNDTERKMNNILHNLERIQAKLQEKFKWKKPTGEQAEVKLPEVPFSSHLLPVQNRAVPKRAFRFAQCTISPMFDLESLSCMLKVSRDFQTVTVSNFLQNYPWNPNRFTCCQVLCSQALSSGQHYWEVDTEHCNYWAVGVASGRIGRNHILGRTSDSCCIEWNMTNELSAWHVVRKTVLSSERPKVVGIWLNFEEGKIAFYSVTDQEKLLFEYPINMTSPLHPAFWLYGLQPGNTLTIRPAKT